MIFILCLAFVGIRLYGKTRRTSLGDKEQWPLKWDTPEPGHRVSLSMGPIAPTLCLEVEEEEWATSGMACRGRSGIILRPWLCCVLLPTATPAGMNISREFTSGLLGTPSGFLKETRWAALQERVIPMPCLLTLPNHTGLVGPSPLLGAIRRE